MIRPEIGKRRYQTRLRPVSGWPDLTALIDVLFLTLIFFFLSSSFVRVSGISVELPRVSPSSVASLEKFIISITPDNGTNSKCLIYFNDQPVSRESLKQQLNEVRGRSRNASVVIRADRRVPFETVAEVIALAESARLSSFIAVNPPSERREAVFGQ